MKQLEIKKHLQEDLLPFWQGLLDEKNGGFYGYMNDKGVIREDAEKGCILNSRILWFFSTAYRLLGTEEALHCAAHAYRFLRDFFYDKTYGGVYWSLHYDGTPADDSKHTYNQAFAIYGLSAYYDASGEKEALRLALDLFDTIETRCAGERSYREAFTRAFEEASNEKLSENGVMAYHTMNTLLHVMEAYTELYRVLKKDDCMQAQLVREKLIHILDIYRKDIYDAQKGRQKVFFDREMNSLIDLYSYGHDIETSWLLDRTLEILGDKELAAPYLEMTSGMAQEIYHVAFDGHSVANECEKGIVDERRVWWVQAESVLGFLNEYRKSGQGRYLDAADAVWEFIKAHFITKEKPAEWYSETDKNGVAKRGLPLVDPWKCPYHNGRMCMELLRD